MQPKTVGEGTAAIRLQKLQTFTSHISLQFIVISHENNRLCLQFFSSREICGKPTVQNIAGSFFKSRNSTPATVDRERRRFACSYRKLEKNADILLLQLENTHRDLQNILKLISSRQHEQCARITPTKSLVTPQVLIWWRSAWKCSIAVFDNDNTIIVLFFL